MGTKIAPPFVFSRADGQLTGISIDLAERLAVDSGRSIEWTVYANVNQMLAAVAKGEVDLAISALTATSDRETLVDFSHPYFITGLGAAVTRDRQGLWIAVVRKIISPGFWIVLAGLVGILAIAGTLIWAVERRRNPDFGGRLHEGLGSAFWWAAVTMTTVGYGDKAPRTFGGRLLALAWMFTSIITISSFTAAITTSLAIDTIGSRVHSLADLGAAKVAVIAGTAATSDPRLRARSARECADLAEAFDLLEQGKVDAVVHDRPLLLDALKGKDRDIAVLPGVVGRQEYAVALPPGSLLREELNRILLDAIATGLVDELTAEHLEE